MEIEYNALEKSCTELFDSFSPMLESLNACKSDYEEALGSVSSSLTAAINSFQNAIDQLNSLMDHISQYIIYHEDILKLIDEIYPKLDDLENKAKGLEMTLKRKRGQSQELSEEILRNK